MTDPEPQPLSDAEVRMWMEYEKDRRPSVVRIGEALLAAREQLKEAKRTRWHHSPDAPPEHICYDCDLQREQLKQAERDRRTVEEQFDAVLADYHEATRRAETAEADCAALREAVGEWREQLCPRCDDGSVEPRRTCCYTAVNAQHTQQCILAQPSPGAALPERVKELEAELGWHKNLAEGCCWKCNQAMADRAVLK